MIDLGATTFWEDFDINAATNNGRIEELTPDGIFDIHGYFLDNNAMRVTDIVLLMTGVVVNVLVESICINMSDAGETVTIKPHLGDLEFAEGTFPTKFGVLKVRHEIDSDGK